jgi:biopolymer transport protein TolQ
MAAPIVIKLWLDIDFWELAQSKDPILIGVVGTLALASVLSWTIVLSKFFLLRGARSGNRKFLRAFRKSARLDVAAAATEQYRNAPVVGVFEFGYSEVCRQAQARSKITNPVALERTLELGVSEEVMRMERNMNWLATVAAVSPFIGLFGTVWGIIDAFNSLGASGSTDLKVVGPGIARALIATALGLGAAIPAAIFYNYFGGAIKEIAARLEDFCLEFLNLTERSFEE